MEWLQVPNRSADRPQVKGEVSFAIPPAAAPGTRSATGTEVRPIAIFTLRWLRFVSPDPMLRETP